MSTRRTGSPRLVGTLSVNTELGVFLGDTRIRLLEAIGNLGSISRAAKSVPMSYSWRPFFDQTRSISGGRNAADVSTVTLNPTEHQP